MDQIIECQLSRGTLFAEEALVDNFLKLARVNVLNGEYEFLKVDRSLQETGHEDTDNMYEYIARQAKDGTVFPEYADEYRRYGDPAYVQRRVFAGEKRLLINYKRRTAEGFRWITFSVIVPVGCSPDNPWVVYCWRDADKDTVTLMDALSTLSVIYSKILKINLTTDTYETVKVDSEEHELFVKQTGRISEWWRRFAEEGNVYAEDLEEYTAFTQLDKLREHFRQSRTELRCRYRRRAGDQYRWACMELVPSVEYTDDNQVLALYVKDIHEEYVLEQRRRQELIDSYNRDALTLLYNRHKYQEDIGQLRKNGQGNLTCLYIDVNGLHELNNHLGHEKGDDMLCTVADSMRRYFPAEKLYRIGGDEFVMLSANLSERKTEQLTAGMRTALAEDQYEISVGIRSGRCADGVEDIIKDAENAMRGDKERYYQTNGHERRRRELNEELENILLEKQYAERFLEAIATKYAGVYFVDLETDAMRHIYIPTYFRELMQETEDRYSKALELYKERLVQPEYHERFNVLLDYDELKRRLQTSETIRESYRKKDGRWMNLCILRLDCTQSDDRYETIWIFTDGDQPAY